MLENRMVIDSEWEEIEYGVPVQKKYDPWEDEIENDRRWEDEDGE